MKKQIILIDNVDVTPADLSVNDSGKLSWESIDVTISGRKVTPVKMIEVTLGFDEKSNLNEGQV